MNTPHTPVKKVVTQSNFLIYSIFITYKTFRDFGKIPKHPLQHFFLYIIQNRIKNMQTHKRESSIFYNKTTYYYMSHWHISYEEMDFSCKYTKIYIKGSKKSPYFFIC